MYVEKTQIRWRNETNVSGFLLRKENYRNSNELKENSYYYSHYSMIQSLILLRYHPKTNCVVIHILLLAAGFLFALCPISDSWNEDDIFKDDAPIFSNWKMIWMWRCIVNLVVAYARWMMYRPRRCEILYSHEIYTYSLSLEFNTEFSNIAMLIEWSELLCFEI